MAVASSFGKGSLTPALFLMTSGGRFTVSYKSLFVICDNVNENIKFTS